MSHPHIPLLPTRPPHFSHHPGGSTDRISTKTRNSILHTHPNRAISRRSRLTRLAIFLTLEISFITLAIVCLRHPIILPDWVKGGLTVVFILWQTLAIFPVRDVILHVFSSEWSIQLSRTGSFVPGTTDRVSTLTAGYLDRVLYTLTGSASWSFRIAFFASLAFLALAGLAPGTFIPGTVFVDMPLTLKIGNLTLSTIDPSGSLSGVITLPMQRAALVTRLETIERSQFGYNMDKNWIMAWPEQSFSSPDKVEYPSDGVHFQHSCHWEPPAVDLINEIFTTSQTKWALWVYELPTTNPNAGRLVKTPTYLMLILL
jgi:hypothetical protein